MTFVNGSKPLQRRGHVIFISSEFAQIAFLLVCKGSFAWFLVLISWYPLVESENTMSLPLLNNSALLLPRLCDIWARAFSGSSSVLSTGVAACRWRDIKPSAPSKSIAASWFAVRKLNLFISVVMDSTTVAKSMNLLFSDISLRWGWFCNQSKCRNSVGNRPAHGENRLAHRVGF